MLLSTGGPGSNKAVVCSQATRKLSNWMHLSMGSLLVTLSASNSSVRSALVAGELVSSDLVMQLLEQQILQNRDANGIVVEGFPRNLNQARDFENKVRYIFLLLFFLFHVSIRFSLNEGYFIFTKFSWSLNRKSIVSLLFV